MNRAQLVVLLVDNDPEEFEIFREAVQTICPDAVCIHKEDGEKGLQYLWEEATQFPDYVFLDINMPVMGGMECLRELKSIEQLRHIPVFIYSTSSSEREKKAFEKCGAEGFIVKPPTFTELVALLKEVIVPFALLPAKKT